MMKPETCTEKLMLHLPPSLRGQIEREAAAEGRSLSSMARRVLERWAAERGAGHERAA